MGVMNEAVEDSVGIGWITDDIVPAVDRKLACDDGGAAAIALLKDFQKILPCLGIEGCKAEVIEYEKIGAAERAQEAAMPAVAPGKGEIGKQFWHSAIENGTVVPAGFVAKSASKPAFAGACFAADCEIVVDLDPIAFAKLLEQRFIETA